MNRLLQAPQTAEAPSDARNLVPAIMDEPLSQEPPFDVVQHYLHEIGQVPLLSAAEEVALAERMERGKAVARRLAAAADLSPQLRAAFEADVAAS